MSRTDEDGLKDGSDYKTVTMIYLSHTKLETKTLKGEVYNL